MNGPMRPLPAFGIRAPAAQTGNTFPAEAQSDVARFRPLSAACRASLAVAVMALAGCQTPAAPFDPFLAGRSTIPPPGTAVQASPAPYYNAAPPVVTVPAPGAGYTAPGAVPAAVPAVTVPSAGGGQLPRGISAPQSSNQTPAGNTQLAVWQSTGDADLRRDGTVASPIEGQTDNKGRSGTQIARSSRNDDRASEEPTASRSDVVRASFDEPSGEAPIRIVEPAAQRQPAGKSSDKSTGKPGPTTPAAKQAEKSRSQRLPELTDFPPADRPQAMRWKSGS